jgi:hypothetical protein
MESSRPEPNPYGSRSYTHTSGPRATPPRRFAAGQLTIVDLSDPFIDPASACGLFEIVTRLFVRTEVETGKVLVVDEAHKVCDSLDLSKFHSFNTS